MSATPSRFSPLASLSRARYAILAVALAYTVSILAGMVMVGRGNSFALSERDRIVGNAAHQAIALAQARGNPVKAALLDFAGNLLVGSLSKSVQGFAIILPFPFVVYQGWVGGVVSVRGDHSSRLDNGHSACYYVLTLGLQIVAYVVAVGGGVNVGWSLFRPSPYYRGRRWLWIFPREALLDWATLYALAAPIFLAASLWEFLSPWNV
jgi:uncharacterized membrane protein SpoIIM required for sporulation